MQTIKAEPMQQDLKPPELYQSTPLRPTRTVVAAPDKISVPALPLNTLLAKRYELKYRVPEHVAVAIRSYIKSFLQPDPYTARQPSGQYPISSLYLDSQHLQLFQETIVDKCNRFKLRIRGYDDDPNSPVFFEIKRKLNRIVYKSRAKVHKSQVKSILSGSYIPDNLPEKDRAALQQFMHYCRCLSAKPVVLVRYQREAYENRSDSKVRITFDRELYYHPAEDAMVKLNGPGWVKIPIDFVVLEIKFTARFPGWIKQMVQMFNLNRQSMSKYCSSVSQLVPAATTGYTMPRLK
ncbi:VTC domain-containing protein [Anaerohalosphaeraceae bacterium U12dextr]